MAEFRLNERSDAELYEIFLYGFLQFGERQADRCYAELKRIFQLIADNPRMGRQAERIGTGVRRHEHGAHIILYEEIKAGVIIRRAIE